MELPVLRNRELRVSFEELAKLLATTQPPEDVIRVLNLTNKKLLRMVQQADFSSTLASVQQPIRVAINVRFRSSFENAFKTTGHWKTDCLDFFVPF